MANPQVQEPKRDACAHAWTLVGTGKIGRVFECKVCRMTWTPDQAKSEPLVCSKDGRHD